MKIFVVRHGKTNANANNFLAGNSNFAQLNEEGLKHAENLAINFKKEDIDAVFVSPLDRAMHTAKPLLETKNLQPIQDKRLVEFDFGDIDNKPREGEVLELWAKSKKDLMFQFPNGESHLELIERTKGFIEELKEKNLNKVMIVAHGITNKTIISHLLEVDLNKAENVSLIHQPNSVVYEIDTLTKECNWLDTLTKKKGEGVLYLEKYGLLKS